MEKTESEGNGAYSLPLFLAGLATGIALSALLTPTLRRYDAPPDRQQG